MVKSSEPVAVDLCAAVPLVCGAALFPWVQGGNDPEAGTWILGLIGLGFIFWLGGLLLRQDVPRVPWVTVLGTIAIALAGAFGVQGEIFPENPFILAHQMGVAARWPEAWIVESGPAWYRVSVLCLLGFGAGADILRRRPEWVGAAAASFVVSGGVMAGVGMAGWEVATSFFRMPLDMPGQSFAGFFHYTPAGAYLNLIWPLALALALWPGPCRSGWARAGRIGAGLAAGFMFAAVWTLPTTAARGISLALLAIISLVWVERQQGGFRDYWERACLSFGRPRCASVLALVFCLLGAFLWATIGTRVFADFGRVEASGPVEGLTAPLPNRGDWMVPSDDPRAVLPEFHRRLAWATAVSMLPDAGLFGAGPRGWRAVYPAYTDDRFLLSFYLHIQFVHNDFLQYLVEWGWFGGAGWLSVWGVIICFGLLRFWRRLEGREAWSPSSWLAVVAWLAVGGCCLHAMVDFILQTGGVLVTAAGCAALALAVGSETVSGVARDGQSRGRGLPPPAQSPRLHGRC